MTKEELIKALNDNAVADEEYYLPPELDEALYSYPNPIELVEPILRIIETNPTVYFGCPGDLVHFAEKLSNNGYEELLIESVKRSPTDHNIFMLHRCFNDPNDPRKDTYRAIINDLKNDPQTSDAVKDSIAGFNWD